MTNYLLSEAADSDVQDIIRTSIESWGIDRAERYAGSLAQVFETLGQFPLIGRDAGHIRPGYLRFEHDSHTIFYRRAAPGILVVRVLHRRQQPQSHL